MDKIITAIGTFFVVLTLLFILALIMAIPTYFLWNWLMPTIFAVKEITLFQAWGIIFLCAVLFKNSSSKSDQ
jgi:hypothetical protein